MMDQYQNVYIIEATFKGMVRAKRLPTIPPFKIRTLDICVRDKFPDLHINGHPKSTARAKTIIDNLWPLEDRPIRGPSISIERIDVAHEGAEALMGLLTFEEIDTCWQHFCQMKEGQNGYAAVNLGQARHALLKEARRFKGFSNGIP